MFIFQSSDFNLRR